MSEHVLNQIGVDRASGVPIYQQLGDQLEQLIADGTWRRQEPLPSETILAERLNISVMTVRQAMAQLVNKGLIYREKGRGTFVSPLAHEGYMRRLESFTEDMRARDMCPEAQILELEHLLPPAFVAERLGIPPDQPVVRLKRLWLVDERPVAVHDAYVSRCDLDFYSLEQGGSLFELLERCGIELDEAEETIEATAADRMTAQLLNLTPGAPLLKVTRLAWDRTKTPVELLFALYRADFYRYATRLQR